MDAFRIALKAASGLESPLRRDLLSLVDRLEEPVAETSGATVGLPVPEQPHWSQEKHAAELHGIPVVDFWEGSLTPRGQRSASPSQSDVEAALQTMDTPPHIPWTRFDSKHSPSCSRSSLEEEQNLDISGAGLIDANFGESVTIQSCTSSGMSWPEDVNVATCPARVLSACSSPKANPRSRLSSLDDGHPLLGEDDLAQSPAASTPIGRRSDMWLGDVPPIPNVEALTPAAPAFGQHGRAQRQGVSLAAARDQFKMSIGARERSRQFRSAVLSELGSLAVSPI